MKNGVILCLSMLCLFLLGFTLTSSKSNTEAEKATMSNLPQVIKSPPIPDYVELAGEQIPTFRKDVYERLDRELMVNAYWQSNTMGNIKMANRYFPIIERIFTEQGVPTDFKYLAVAESDLRLKTSGAGAKGYWQFMKESGKQYNLEINDEVDERYHIEKSTLAAAKYIKSLYNRFGTWAAAAAAYNVGPTRLSRIMEEQGSRNYYDLNLNDETSRYVFRVIAIKYIMKSPESYGFYLKPEDLYSPLTNYYEVLVDKSVTNWATFAKQYNVSYRDFKIYNPWLMDNKLTVLKNSYTVKIPT